MRAFSRDRPKPLFGLVRRQKLGTDPALQAGVLDLDPVPLPACSCEPRALGGGAKNGRVSGGCRPDVYAGTLQKDEIPVLRRGGSLGRHSTWSNLGRSLDGERSGRNHTGRSARWLRHSRRSRLHRSPDGDCAAIAEDVVSAGTFAPGEARKKYVSPATPNAAMIAVPAISFRRAPNVSYRLVSYRLLGSSGWKESSPPIAGRKVSSRRRSCPAAVVPFGARGGAQTSSGGFSLPSAKLFPLGRTSVISTVAMLPPIPHQRVSPLPHRRTARTTT